MTNKSGFRLYFSNREQEIRALPQNSQTSSAGDFSILLQNPVDFTALLQFSSSTAKVAIDTLSITSLPLTFHQNNHYDVSFEISEMHSLSNKFFTKERLSKENGSTSTVYIGSLKLLQRDPSAALDVVNSTMRKHLKRFMFMRLLELYCDRHIFSRNAKMLCRFETQWGLSKDCHSLLDAFLEMASFARYTCLEYLHMLLGRHRIDPINYKQKQIPSNRFEEIIETNNDVFLKQSEFKPSSLSAVPVEKVQDLSLSLPEDREGLKLQLLQHFKEDFIQPILQYTYTFPTQLTDACRRKLDDLATSMSAIYHFNAFLKHELDQEFRKSTSMSLARSALTVITLQKNEMDSKLRVDFNTMQHVPLGTSITIKFDHHVSKILGGVSEKQLTIGPIIKSTEHRRLPLNAEKFSSNLVVAEQMSTHSINVLPRSIFLFTDICKNNSQHKSHWLRSSGLTPLVSGQVTAAQLESDSFFCKGDHLYLPMYDELRQLERFHVSLVDENYCQLYFPLQTDVYFSMDFEPI